MMQILAPGLGGRLRRWFALNPVSGVILIACLLIEAALEGADYGLWGTQVWREAVFAYGAFWAGLLHPGVPSPVDLQMSAPFAAIQQGLPMYPAEPALMFLSYAFLHGGFWHVALNMLTLVQLGRPVAARLGQARYLALYILTGIAGGAGFALFSYSTEPMVGASGALFGLAGALLAWAWADRRRVGMPARAAARVLARPILYLVGLNVLMFWAMNGGLAWGAHLGGFLAGWVLALLFDRPRYPRFANTRS